MKLEYIANGSQDTPLMRLYDFDEAAAVMLHKIAAALESGGRNEVRLHELDGVEPIDSCRLTLKIGDRDEGVRRENTAFTCVLTRETWGQVTDLIEPLRVPETLTPPFPEMLAGHQP